MGVTKIKYWDATLQKELEITPPLAFAKWYDGRRRSYEKKYPSLDDNQ